MSEIVSISCNFRLMSKQENVLIRLLPETIIPFIEDDPCPICFSLNDVFNKRSLTLAAGWAGQTENVSRESDLKADREEVKRRIHYRGRIANNGPLWVGTDCPGKLFPRKMVPLCNTCKI